MAGEALEKWLEDFAPDRNCACDHDEHCACMSAEDVRDLLAAAWEASNKHTLEYVSSKLDTECLGAAAYEVRKMKS